MESIAYEQPTPSVVKVGLIFVAGTQPRSRDTGTEVPLVVAPGTTDGATIN